jgi:hypothetical protein
MGRLEGKVAIVSGAGSVGPGWGNGRATAVRFAQEGAQVFAVDKDAERLRETLEKNSSLKTYLCDLLDSGQVEKMVGGCVARSAGSTFS